MSKRETATLPQGIHLLNLLLDQELEPYEVEYLKNAGLFSDLLCCDPHGVDRVDFQIALRIRRIVKGFVHRNDWSPQQLLEKSVYRNVSPNIKFGDGYFRFPDFVHGSPLRRTQGPIDFHIVTFRKYLTPQKAEERMKSWGLRPVDLIEFLSFGTSIESLFETYRNQSYHQTYVGLGSWIGREGSYGRQFPSMNYLSDPIIELTGQMFETETTRSSFEKHIHFVGVPLSA
jgi:hypothetical protein